MAVEVHPVASAAREALKSRAGRINELNVYPVPDGDTGTNMLLTLDAVVQQTAGKTYPTVQEASRAVSRAALMGARGNSGVILSQMVRGACEALEKAEGFDAASLVAALEGASERAYSAVRQPVEGTMLTVIRDAAQAAREALESGEQDPARVAGVAVREALASVGRTKGMLETLRRAGVVDAGGLGVATILEGIRAVLAGESPEFDEETSGEGLPDLESVGHEEEAWGYCTEFVVTGFTGDAEDFREHIHRIGRSVLVVPDADVVKVHLHTQDPGEALSYAGRFGRLSGVKVDDMEAQVRERSEETAAGLGVVAVSRGEGNRRLFESMGAIVVEGGQGANPSAEEIARAVRRSGAREVVVLPNNKNVIPAAEQARELVEARLHVIPTTTVASGLAAMVAFDPEEEPEEVVEEMRELLSAMRQVQITRAVRDAEVAGNRISEGQYMAFLDGELASVGGSVDEVALAVARTLVEEGAGLLTLLAGEGLGAGEVEEIASKIEALDGEVEVEVREGGQPLYPLEMVAE